MKETMKETRASSLHIGYQCPGAPWLLRGLTTTPVENDQLRLGTIAHEFLALAIDWSLGKATRWLEEGAPEMVPEMLRVVEWIGEQEFAPLLRQGHVEMSHRLELGDGVCLTGHTDWCGWFANGAVVIDWKWGHGQKWFLPPIEKDLQMLAYAQMVGQHEDHVEVYRVLISSEEVHHLELDREQLGQDQELLQLVVGDIVDNPDKRITGPHCEHCLARKLCPERLQVAEQSLALVPLDPGLLALTTDQATQYALARGALKERLEELDEALTRYLEAGGEVEVNDRYMAVSRYEVDQVTNHDAVIADLAREIGGWASIAVQTNKYRVLDALKAAGQERQLDELLERWRQHGWVEKNPRQALRWRKRREEVRSGPV
jgi:hypothetical protein